jgi:hypothetical protein
VVADEADARDALAAGAHGAISREADGDRLAAARIAQRLGISEHTAKSTSTPSSASWGCRAAARRSYMRYGWGWWCCEGVLI